MTKKLYWENPYETKFSAVISSIKTDGIILDKTLFYPESGNQQADKGIIKIGNDKFEIIGVSKDNNEIIHHISPELGDKIKVGDKVEGEIDWEYRYGLMKAHSSQHIFSAMLKSMYDLDTLRAILNFEDVFLQISQTIDYDQLKKILYKVNRICTLEEHKIAADLVSRDVTQGYANEIRGKIPNESEIRLLKIDKLDIVCCGGTHVRETTEIGSLFIYDFKKGNEIRYYVGNKAILNSSKTNIDLIHMSNNLNSPLQKVMSVIAKQLELLENIQKEQKELSIKLLKASSKSPLKVINNIPLFHIDSDIDIKIINKILPDFPQNSLIIVSMENNKLRIISLSEKLDANSLMQRLIQKSGGKGGGSPKSSQGFLEKIPENIIDEIESMLK
ncbi:MAG: alanyl-tRNA editing protein [Candidatus Lokiarchaeota archaeon]|nr:alanyl-tRNA editing protein [Candidatus Lokiarchaeota archaeon]